MLMHRKKDEIRDIYQGSDHDFEKDFTPQVARELLETRQRDLRRSRIISTFFGGLVIVLSVGLVSLVIRGFLNERIPSQKIRTPETPYIPRYSLPADALWVMDYQHVAAQAETEDTSGPKPVSTKWVKNAAYHIIMGQQALALKQTEEALEHFQKVVGIYPGIEGLHQAMGTLYLQRAEYATAARHLEKALQEEESFEVINNLGTAFIGTEEYDKAEKQLKRALELQPENPGCHKNLALLYREMKRDNEAVFHYEKYLDLRPDDLDTLQAYALYLTKLGRWKDAATFLTRLTQDVTNVAPVYFLLAQVQVQNGQPEKAMDALKRGIQLVDPALALAWMSREEFNAMRDTGEFKSLVDRLEIATVSLERKK
jgi:Tfp pilus assembly protein PilF